MKIKYWESECGDCGFVSGMVEVRYSDNTGFSITGAGCRTRRDLKAVQKLVQEKIGAEHDSSQGTDS